jgi:hypothetical protein
VPVDGVTDTERVDPFVFRAGPPHPDSIPQVRRETLLRSHIDGEAEHLLQIIAEHK